MELIQTCRTKHTHTHTHTHTHILMDSNKRKAMEEPSRYTHTEIYTHIYNLAQNSSLCDSMTST